MVYVYILQNPEGRFYVGQTQDLAVRLLTMVTLHLGHA
jgi:predicted GIY-YIG superfamily endonuclease